MKGPKFFFSFLAFERDGEREMGILCPGLVYLGVVIINRTEKNMILVLEI